MFLVTAERVDIGRELAGAVISPPLSASSTSEYMSRISGTLPWLRAWLKNNLILITLQSFTYVS